MFRALNLGATLDGTVEALHSVSRSTEPLAIPLGSGPPQPTRAYVIALHDATPSLYRVYVYLGRTEPQAGNSAGLLFAADPAQVSTEGLIGLLDEAAEICAAQGFTLERVALEILTAEELTLLGEELPFAPREVPAPPVAPRTASGTWETYIGQPVADTPTSPVAAVVGPTPPQDARIPLNVDALPRPRQRDVRMLASILSLF